MGDKEIQEAARSQKESETLVGTHSATGTRNVCSLEMGFAAGGWTIRAG